MKKKYSMNNMTNIINSDNVNSDKINSVSVIFNENNGGQVNAENLEKPADFETAITATGFGKFNFLLALIAIPSAFATVFDTTAMAYIFPIAQCDLDLSLDNKGTLNAITFLGMITSAFIWGYLADTIGRKKLLAYGYLLDGFFVILCGFSQQYNMMVATKFMTGFIINGPFAAFVSYINEFHPAKYRTVLPLMVGVLYSVANIILPSLAWLIFSDKINISIFNGAVVLRSWNVFLFVCSLPSLIAGFGYLALPESPKFLMTTGRNEEALQVFRKVYSCNSGKPPNTYSIKTLLDETKLHENDENTHGGHVTANRSTIQALKEGWQQILPLFYPPYLGKILLVFTIQFGILMGLNTLRLWLPQLFAAINDYQTFYGDEDADICKMLELLNPNKIGNNKTCIVNYANDSIYTNNIIVASVAVALYLSAAIVIQIIGKKFVLVGTGLCSGLCGIGLYLARTEAAAVALSSIFNALMGVSSNVIVSVVVDIFPTTLRTMTVSLTMMSGRTGSMLGNFIFPILLGAGCLPPFVMVGCLAIGSGLLSLALPKTDMKPLE